MKKRILALLLALCMGLSCAATGACAAEVSADASIEGEDSIFAPEETEAEAVSDEESEPGPEEEAEPGREPEAGATDEEEAAEEGVEDAPVSAEDEPESYGLWVGGVEVTSANADAILRDEDDKVTAQYAAATHTLTLTDAVIPGTNGTDKGLIDFVCYDENVTLTVEGSAVLGNDGCTASGISVSGCNLAVNGTGSGIQYKGNYRGIGCYYNRPQSNIDPSGGSLTLQGTISVTSTNSDAVFASWDLTVQDGAELTATTASATEAGLHSYYGPITIKGGTVHAEGGNGIEVFTNTSVESGHVSIENGNVTAIGRGGSKYYTRKGYGIYGWYGITIERGTVTARSESTGKVYDSYGLNAYKGGIEIKNGITSVTASSNPEAQSSAAIYAGGNLTIGNQLSLTDPVNGAYGTLFIYQPDSNTPATQCTLEPGTTPIRRSLINAMLTLDQNYLPYTGEVQMPKGTLQMLTDGTVLQEGQDYELSYCTINGSFDDPNARTYLDPRDAGIYYVFAKGKRSYSGECRASYTISSIRVNDAGVTVSISGIVDKPYTGSKITQTPKVVVNGRTLVQDKDYWISYKNNVEVGTASYTIMTKGSYRGSFDQIEGGKGTFQILPKQDNPSGGGGTSGGGNPAPAPVQKKGNTISGAASFTKTANTQKDQTFQLNASANGANLTFRSGSKSVTVKNGTVTIQKCFVGKAAIKITAAETANYKSAVKTVTVTVNPSATQLSSVKAGKKGTVTVQWKKNTTGKGYQLQYSTDKAFKKGVKTLKIGKNGTVKATVKKLKAKKVYYFRIRTVSGQYASGWSRVKKVTAKK